MRSSEAITCANIYALAWHVALANVDRLIDLDVFQQETKGEIVHVVVHLGEVVGYISVWTAQWFIHHLYVHPNYHRAGFGGSLLNHARDLAGENSLSLKCQTANTQAIGFYLSNDFIESSEQGCDEFGTWIQLVQSAR